MLRLLNSADWQLGARFAQRGLCGGRLREARLETFKRSLDLAAKHEADAFLMASGRPNTRLPNSTHSHW